MASELLFDVDEIVKVLTNAGLDPYILVTPYSPKHNGIYYSCYFTIDTIYIYTVLDALITV